VVTTVVSDDEGFLDNAKKIDFSADIDQIMVNKLKETIKNDHLLNSSKVKIPSQRMTKKEI
jgi:hypothetical protein